MNASSNEITSLSNSRFYYQQWLRIYLLSLLCYSPFIFNFIWGNHDWQWMREYTPLASGIFEGRFSQFILQTLLFEGNILPILTIITSFAFLSFATVMLLRLWNTHQKSCFFIILGINITCSPYSISWLYFSFITLSIFSWVSVIISAYYLLEQYQKTSHKIAIPLISSTLFMLALGGYPPVINLICTIFFTLIIKDLCLNNLTPQTIFRKYTIHAFTIIVSIVQFLLIQWILKYYNLQHDTYNTSQIHLSEFISKFIFSISQSIKQFFITTTFISHNYKYFGLCLVLLAILYLWKKLPKTTCSILLFICSIFGLLFSTVITLFAAQNTSYVLNAPRIDFFSIPYIYIFSASILLNTPSLFIRNITTLVLTYLMFTNFTTTSTAQKVWSQGFRAETSLIERILSRIESHPDFNSQKKYSFVQGGTLDFRSHFYQTTENTPSNSYTLTAPYIPWHLPSNAYKFYYPKDFFGADFDIFWSFVNHRQLDITPSFKNYIFNTSDSWPSANAIYIENNTIILTLTYDGKIRAINWLNNI